MHEYRIYLLDDGGRIVSASSRSCVTDTEACDVARKGLGIAGQAEVWQGTRCLGRVYGPPAQEAPRAADAFAAR